MPIGLDSSSNAQGVAEQETAETVHHRLRHPVAQGGGLVVLLALITLALNLRSPLTAIPPVITSLQADLGISSSMVGLLTSIPVLCFGILTPFASMFIARAGIEISIFITLAGTGLGTIIRPAGGTGSLIIGTLIIGAALTIGNIVSLMVIARDFPKHTPAVTGIYAFALNIGTMLTSAMTAPLAASFDWRFALTFWVVLAMFSGLFWGLVLRFRKQVQSKAPETTPAAAPSNAFTSVWHRPVVWLLVVAFSAHLFIYYGMTAWLPAYLMQVDGMNTTSAGLAASAFQFLSLLGSFGIPVLAATTKISRASLLVAMAIAWFVTPLGLLVAPGYWFLWFVIGGVAQGGGFTVIFMLIVDSARDLDENRKISSAVQGLGYAIAAAGPFVVGRLHEASGEWRSSYLLLAGVALLMATAGIGVSKPVQKSIKRQLITLTKDWCAVTKWD